MEVWKDIKGFKDYKISNTGKIRSLERYVNSSYGATRLIKGRIRKLQNDKDGYKILSLRNNDGIIETIKVARLVGIAFISNFKNKPQINHIDSNKQNNNVENLEWCDNSENQLHSYRTTSRIAHIDKAREYSILSRRRKVKISKGSIIKTFDSMRLANDYIGCSSGTVGKVARGNLQSIYGWSVELI
jgi:hypothetical protein